MVRKQPEEVFPFLPVTLSSVILESFTLVLLSLTNVELHSHGVEVDLTTASFFFQ